MKHVGKEIDRIIHENRFVKKEIALKSGISSVYLSQILQKESIDALLLEKISNAIGITPAYFFDDFVMRNNSVNHKNIAANNSGMVNINQMIGDTTEEELKLLRQLLAEKERTIQILISKVSETETIARLKEPINKE